MLVPPPCEGTKDQSKGQCLDFPRSSATLFNYHAHSLYLWHRAECGHLACSSLPPSGLSLCTIVNSLGSNLQVDVSMGTTRCFLYWLSLFPYGPVPSSQHHHKNAQQWIFQDLLTGMMSPWHHSYHMSNCEWWYMALRKGPFGCLKKLYLPATCPCWHHHLTSSRLIRCYHLSSWRRKKRYSSPFFAAIFFFILFFNLSTIFFLFHWVKALHCTDFSVKPLSSPSVG